MRHRQLAFDRKAREDSFRRRLVRDFLLMMAISFLAVYALCWAVASGPRIDKFIDEILK